MNNRLEDVINGKEENYILPFLWLHGEQEPVLREYMDIIERCGIHEVCLESRPHPDFLGDKWWHDLDIILEEAEKRKMGIWILDDSHFPTGYANGAVKNVDKRLKKWHLVCNVTDLRGPLKNRKHPVATRLGQKADPVTGDIQTFEEELVAVLADRRIDEDTPDTEGSCIDLTDHMRDGYLYWDVPEGKYRIYTISKRLDACTSNNDYVNLLEKDSVRILINTVYEAHYFHYKEKFGNTIRGFFSDEPGFYNSAGAEFDFSLKPGNPLLPLPWGENMMELFTKELGCDAKTILPALWYPMGENTDKVRYHYMNLVSKLYSENFTQQIGKWCQEHKVEYIGHVVEDENVHSRLGAGTGHYFRAMKGQHMAGIDVVLNQILPGNDYSHSSLLFQGNLADGTFYHYGLAKLGVSAAHQNSEMKGRCMCELFGAYGWSEGVTLMKWLVDHMLVRGVNEFVPHAFSMREFPDADCPPHFYAHGKNPQFPYMHLLFRYMNRMAHLLSGGKSSTRIAVLYHGESDWVGNAMPFQTVGKKLMQEQMDYEVVCLDSLRKSSVENRKLYAGNAVYECLIVPDIKKITFENMVLLERYAEEGLCVLYVDHIPSVISGEDSFTPKGEVCSLRNLSNKMKELGLNEIEISEKLPGLRFYQYEQADARIYMFFNENISEKIETTVDIKISEQLYRYDAMDNSIEEVEMASGNKSFLLKLEAGESAIFVNRLCGKTEKKRTKASETLNVLDKWKISIESYQDRGTWIEVKEQEKLLDLSEIYPFFSGIIRYECDFGLTKTNQISLCLENVTEAVEVLVNGKPVGTRIAPPYHYNLNGFVKKGINHIQIDLATTLRYSQRDPFSLMTSAEPMGILGPVKIIRN